MPIPPRHAVTVTALGEYIRHQSCDRRFHLTVHNDREVRVLPFFDRLLNTLEPVLAQVGDSREEQWEEELKAAGFANLVEVHKLSKGKRDEVTWGDLAGVLAALRPGDCGYARQVRVQADLGAFNITGHLDFVLVRWDGKRPRVWLVECKASRRDRTYHRVQVTVYRMLLRQMLGTRVIDVGGVMVPVDAVAGVIARIDEDSNANQSILDLEPLDLGATEEDVRRLLAHGGRLDRAVSGKLADIGFKLDTKCDGCIYNVHCLTESARLRRPELLGLDPVTVRLLAAAGLKTLDHLADPPMIPTPAMEDLLRNPGFDEDLKLLRVRARARRHTLPVVGGKPLDEEYDVECISYPGSGRLPPYDSDHGRLLRVYLNVDYDYSENRVGALAAHVTRSEGRIHTAFGAVAGKWQPLPGVWEQVADSFDEKGRPKYSKDSQLRSVVGRQVVEFKESPWSGTDTAADTAAEGELIRRFFTRLVEAMRAEAGADAVPIHFYVWNAAEVKQLIEGCGRVEEGLLGHLTQLFGCREGLEQLLYSAVGEEIDRRFALGWTGRGLGVVASLRWFGRRYHWKRVVNGATLDLDHAFTQNVFDFKTQLNLDAAGGWANEDEGTRHTFEIRSRFSDSLPAAYWHAVWGKLDASKENDPRLKSAIERYNRAKDAWVLTAYLEARCQALRWLEENVTPKNADITKPAVTLADLPAFHLGRDDVAKSALDFLRFDHHVKKSDWIAERLAPPIARVQLGRTLPLSGVRTEKDKKTIKARIHLSGFNGLTLRDLETRCAFAAGSFVRLCPWNGDPQRGQTVKQLTSGISRTCVVKEDIDWKTGTVTLENLYAEEDVYTLPSGGSKQAETLFTDGYATLDESVTDFVAKRVDTRLQVHSDVYAWFDRTAPAPPPVPAYPDADRIGRFLHTLSLPPANLPAVADQVQAVVEGLSTRVQLLQGPPGTGKTTTTALAVLVRAMCHVGPGGIILLAAHTHRAVNELLARIARYTTPFHTHATAAGFEPPVIQLVKAHSGESTDDSPEGVKDYAVSELKTKKKLNELTDGKVLAVGGTTGGLLKLASEVGKLKTYNGGNGLAAALLVVDEASMMVFPHFLALATLIGPNGRVMLTGDHNQLSPIKAHEWDTEDRPPTKLYQPFASAYESVRTIIHRPTPPTAAYRSALRMTFRLPPVVRELIARIYRDDPVKQDRIELVGPNRETHELSPVGYSLWHHVWRWNIGVFLIVHDEAGSKRSNETELEIVKRLLDAAPPLDAKTIAVITPHRAQRSLFTSVEKGIPHGDDRPVDTIDTVERLQGGERRTVIVSATVSDPSAIEGNVEFVLDLNRANVAFSRVIDRLVVVCARSLLDHIPAEVTHYDQAKLWKALREFCTVEVGTATVNGHTARLLMPSPERIAACSR